MRGRVVENGIGQAEECERSPGRVEGMMNRQKPGEAEGERGETESGRAVALGTVGGDGAGRRPGQTGRSLVGLAFARKAVGNIRSF